jgi:sulfopyruvate decarboxylase TPP-binding subunit
MKVEAAKAAHNAIIEAGINFIACLPDSAFQELYLPLSEDPRVAYIQVASENDGVASSRRCLSKTPASPWAPTRCFAVRWRSVYR